MHSRLVSTLAYMLVLMMVATLCVRLPKAATTQMQATDLMQGIAACTVANNWCDATTQALSQAVPHALAQTMSLL